MKYKIKFIGREKNAIGAMYNIQTEVEAKDKDSAILKLYDKFEHVTNPEITPIENCGIFFPNNHSRFIG